MAIVASPYGLRPSKMLGDGYQTGGFTQYKIASGYATSIFQGDLVSLAASAGTIIKETGTTAISPIGVFWGVEFITAANGLAFKNSWTASTTVPANTTAWAYVIDHPDYLFEMQASATLTQNAIGTNANVVQNAGNAFTGVSAVSLNAATIATTATLPIRIMSFVDKQGFSQMGDAFPDLLVRINTHFNRAVAGSVA